MRHKRVAYPRGKNNKPFTHQFKCKWLVKCTLSQIKGDLSLYWFARDNKCRGNVCKDTGSCEYSSNYPQKADHGGIHVEVFCNTSAYSVYLFIII